MECNRDEAVRARDLAEIKYAKQDFVGAKKFVLKAQQLFPGLEGLSQMLQVVEVHSVAQSKLGGTEMDWYGILQVDPNADDGTIKKQYRKLALLLHPDKNKAVGAEAAFKLIGEAWGVLSDKMKRQMHDMKRIAKSKPSHVRVVVEPSTQAFQTPFNAASVPPAPHAPQTGQTFWTACPSCKMQYQYLRTYENYQLQCPKCKEVFMARDIHSATPSNGAGGFGWQFDPHRQDFGGFNKQPASAAFNGAGNGFTNGGGTGRGGFNSFHNPVSSAGYFSGVSSAAAAAAAQSKVAAAAAAAAAASSAVPPNNLAADVVQQTFHKVKRERVEAEKENKRKEKEMRKKEKDELRREKEEQKKAREAERSREAMERLMAKKKEQEMARDAGKRKGDARAGRKLKRKKRDSEQEDDEDLEDDDPKIYEQSMQDDLSSPALPRRRSSRAKKSVATYKVDMSDDSDSELFPAAKRGKMEGGAEDGVKSEDEEAGREQSENGMKGKSVANDSNHVKRNSGEELDANEKNRGDQGGARKKDPNSSNSVETPKRSDFTARGSKLHDSPSVSQRMKGGKSSQRAELPSTVKEIHLEGDFRDENSPSKSPRTLRNRIRSPKVSFGSQAVHIEDDQMQQQPVPSPTESPASTPSSVPDSEDEDVQKIVVPDPDFHDFDKYRNESDILPGQIWAIYDDQDGMPRFYGRISRVSTKPFKAHMNWLEHSASSDKESAWTKSTGLSIACGEFKIAKSTVMDQINTFSHIVMDKSGKTGMLKIYPKKGQVWAVYRDWDAEQRIGPAGVDRSGRGSPYTYDMVEILSDFDEKRSQKAAVLLKISGYKTVFSRQEGLEAVRYFKPTELVKFSHSVPNQRIDDDQADPCGIPRGALELDPASTPLDLIMSPSDPLR